MDMQIPITNRKTIDVPPPRAARAITQPGYHRPNFAELAQDAYANSAKAYDLIDDAIAHCLDRHVRAFLQRLLNPIAAVKNTSVALQALCDVTARTAPPTVPLDQGQQQGQQQGRMSLPQLQPMPPASPWVSATPILPLRPHKGWRE